jgi:hypothetical protein
MNATPHAHNRHTCKKKIYADLNIDKPHAITAHDRHTIETHRMKIPKLKASGKLTSQNG